MSQFLVDNWMSSALRAFIFHIIFTHLFLLHCFFIIPLLAMPPLVVSHFASRQLPKLFTRGVLGPDIRSRERKDSAGRPGNGAGLLVEHDTTPPR